MKQLMKVALMLVLLVSVLGAGLKADAAVTKPATTEKVEKKPYEYEFKVDNTAMYNGFTGAKKMVVTFDKVINPILLSDVYVEQMVDGKGVVVPIVASVAPTPPSTSATKELIITFKNLELIDHVGKEDFQLVIKQGKLYFDQITDYVLPFKFYDLTPGFNSVFLDVDNADKINTNIFKYNEPRNVMIQVPPVYMTKIETIHRYLQASTNKSPSLSNIDVIADPVAARLKVNIGTNPNHSRDLSRSTAGVNGFSMGQAGIDSITCKDPSDLDKECIEYNASDNIQLVAYSKDGRKLETRNFKMRVNDLEKDFKINDYVKANPKLYGKPISLYDLMASPTLLNNIMVEIPLDKLDDFGVVYSVGNEGVVKTRDQFLMALQNEQLKKVVIEGSINLQTTEPFVVNHDVTISGGSIIGDIKLGIGEKRLIRMENTNVTGNLTVDVGSEGTAVLNNVKVEGTTPEPHTKIVSGGINSIYLNLFTSQGGISLENKEPVKIVTTDSTGEVKADEFPSLYLKGAGIVHLQGKFNEVNLQPGTKGIHFISNSKINRLVSELVDDKLEKVEFTGTKVEVKNYDELSQVLKRKLGDLQEVIPGNPEDQLDLKIEVIDALQINDLNETQFVLDELSKIKVGYSFHINDNWEFKCLLKKDNNEKNCDITGIELISLPNKEYAIKVPQGLVSNTVYEAEFLITINKNQYKLKIPFTVSG